MLQLMLLLVACALGCAGAAATGAPAAASVAPNIPVVRPDCPRATSLDEAAISAELGCLLAHYVRIDTTNPPGQELAAARFVAALAEAEGLPTQIIESAPGRGNVLVRLPGKRAGDALLFLHHMDVVPASAAEWSAPPFGGELRDGELWGRGTLDNKGPGMASLLALLLAKRLGMQPERDLWVLGVADEENGGGFGARWLLQQRPELFRDVSMVLNEGGAIVELPGGHVAYSVEIAQKAPLWLRITAEGPSGHGSTPRADSSVNVLLRALSRLVAHEFPVQVGPEVAALFAARGQGLPSPAREQYADLARSLEDPTFRSEFLADPSRAGLVRTTLSVTMLDAGVKENVLPPTASAVADLRLLPGQDPDAITAELVRVMSEPALKVEPILSWQAHTAATDTALFGAIKQLAAERDPGAVVASNVVGGFTDCNAFRAHGLLCYGFLPMHIGVGSFGLIHGHDERVNVAALGRSVLATLRLIELVDAR
jgi:acetylornithine deacetylase/succinyl-diaminopimelate desuccinylase-like protein